MKNRYEQTTATAGNLQQRQVSEYRSRLRPSQFARDALAWIAITFALGTIAAYAIVIDGRQAFGWGATLGLLMMVYRMLVWDRERLQSERDAEYQPGVMIPEPQVRIVSNDATEGSHTVKFGAFNLDETLAQQFARNVLKQGKLTREAIPAGLFTSLHSRYSRDIAPEFKRLGIFDDRLRLTEEGTELMKDMIQ